MISKSTTQKKTKKKHDSFLRTESLQLEKDNY